jgi:hypothetical protein
MNEKPSKGPVLKPLGVTCKSTKCESGLHCFEKTRKETPASERGRCISCGAQLVDWDRVQAKNPADVQNTFNALKYEMWRHHFWHVELDQRAINYARRKGRLGLRDAVRKRLSTSIGGALPFHDGFQTPRENSGNPIYYAQHATASCCRKCVEKWHGIPQGRELTDSEIDYLKDLALLYIDDRLPFLTEQGERVPSIRTH